MSETLTIGDDHAAEVAENLLDNFDRFLVDRLREGKDRRDFAMVAANITEDRYSAGSTAARATLIILLQHGLQAAQEFMADLEHHEH